MQSSFKSSCLFVLGLSSLFSSILFAQSRQTPAQRWEYFTAYLCNHNREEMNKYGDDGWELISVLGESTGSCGNYTFKRLKPTNAPQYVDPAKRPIPPPPAPTCKLTLTQAPAFRGIRLGMDVKELLRLFPGSEENPEIKRKLEHANKPMAGFGLTDFQINASWYQNVKEVRDLFADVDSYGFSVFDGRLTDFRVRFKHRNEYGWGPGEWQKKLAEALKLPITDKWGNPDYNSDERLQCEGFSVYASGGSSPSFALVETPNPPKYEVVRQRARAAIEKLQQEFKVNP